jgi:hypothetical protein
LLIYCKRKKLLNVNHILKIISSEQAVSTHLYFSPGSICKIAENHAKKNHQDSIVCPEELHKHSKTTFHPKLEYSTAIKLQFFTLISRQGPAGQGGNGALLYTAFYLSIFHQLLPGSRRKPAK